MNKKLLSMDKCGQILDNQNAISIL